MTKDLTQEEIVTRILSSNEILRKQKENFYISNPSQVHGNLGNYLSCLSNTTKATQEPQFSKYSFIKNKWIIE